MALMGSSQNAAAAPAGAAQNLSVYQQQCTSSGMVQVTFVWSPSGQGNQWFDITRLPNFSAYGSTGQLSSSAYYTAWTLEPNTTFFARVNTFTSSGWRTSDTLQLQTVNCGVAFTNPHNVNATVYDDFVRINWQAGSGNLSYCVDTAFTQSDLVNIQGSWHNWGCGTTSTSLDLSNLACGRTHYYRVWAAGYNDSGYSEIDTFVAPDCNFSPPTDPNATVQTDNTVRVTWDRGENNLFYCVDLALTTDDLTSVSGTWRNAACGTTGTAADLSGLACDTTYYYRIWGAGSADSGYSSIDNFTTHTCDFDAAHNLEATVNVDSVTFNWDDSNPESSYYCVDYAETQSDLTNFGDTWANKCTTSETAQVSDLDPGTYYWRVFGYAGNVNGYSDIEQFTVPNP
jgi:hypothetical protein